MAEDKNFLEKLGITGYFDNSCPKGWEKLVTDLIIDITNMGWDRNLSQVKEKYGGLRFYIGSATDEVFERIDQAETDSESICQFCGDVAELRDFNGWYITLCDKCFVKESKRRK